MNLASTMFQGVVVSHKLRYYSGLASPAYGNAICSGSNLSANIYFIALETKIADAQVEYKRVDLQSYETRNGASFAQSFKGRSSPV